MDDALDFILDATLTGRGSEIFLPKLRSYSILNVKNALHDLLGNTGDEVIGIRPGEKLHETLLNNDEMRYSWSLEDKYLLTNPLVSDEDIKKQYSGIKKITNMERYSSDIVESISIDELKQLIQKSGMLDVD